MSFTAPVAFFAFAILPGVIVLYFLKRKRKEQVAETIDVGLKVRGDFFSLIQFGNRTFCSAANGAGEMKPGIELSAAGKDEGL